MQLLRSLRHLRVQARSASSCRLVGQARVACAGKGASHLPRSDVRGLNRGTGCRTDVRTMAAAAAATPTSGLQVQSAQLASGYGIPVFGFGTFALPPSQTTEAVRSALELGYRHIDSAVCYNNEAEVGQAINDWIKAGKGKREDLFVTTKIWSHQKSRKGAEAAVQSSLDAFKLDYLDLCLIHWPHSDQPADELTPSPQETWEGLSAAVDRGLVRSIGVSNHSPEKIGAWYSSPRIPVSVNQVEIHPQFRNERLVDFCQQKNIHVTAYAPLGSPQQMDQMGKDIPDLLTKNEVVRNIASKLGKTPAQVLLAWGMQRGISVIPKATTAAHQQDNAGALGWELPEEDFKNLSQLDYQVRGFGGSFCVNEKGPWRTPQELWDE